MITKAIIFEYQTYSNIIISMMIDYSMIVQQLNNLPV